MGFNINHQTAGVINNVEGNQVIRGDQHAELMQLGGVRKAVQELENGARALQLEDKDYAVISAQLREIKAEVSRAEPRPAKVVEPLRKITEIAGAASALAGLAGPIQNLLAWLGPLGQSIAKAFPGMF